MAEEPTAPKEEFAGKYSIITVGDAAVGKTCLAQRFIGMKFNESHITTVGIDNMSKKVTKGDKTYLFQIWDTTGQERFASMAKQYLRKAHGVLFVFAYNDKKSYEDIHKWQKMSERHARTSGKDAQRTCSRRAHAYCRRIVSCKAEDC